MSRRNQPGIIRYTFGLEGKGIPALLNIRMALVGLVLFSFCGGLIFATLQRSDVSIRVGRNQLLLPRYVDNHLVANFYTVFLTNRTNDKVEISLALDNPQKDITMSGATNKKKLAPGEKIRFDIALEAGQETLVSPRPVNITVVGINGKLYESTTIFLTKPRQKNDQQ